MRRSRESHRHFRSHLVQLHWPANEAAKSARVADLAQPRASLVNTQSMIVGFKFEFRRAARSQRRTNSSGPTEALITRAVCVAAPEAEVETEASRVFIIAGPLFRSIGLIYRLLARTLERQTRYKFANKFWAQHDDESNKIFAMKIRLTFETSPRLIFACAGSSFLALPLLLAPVLLLLLLLLLLL